MSQSYNEARVILRSDGSVHIAFRDRCTIYATPENILSLFSNPFEFIETGRLSYADSTCEANRKRAVLDDILGVTLASVNSDKQILCQFPELFQCIVSTGVTDKEKKTPLNMKRFEFETVLSDEKSFLLRHYLELAGSLKTPLTIKKNIRLRDEVQFAIIREILNAFFDEELPDAAPPAALSEQIDQIEQATVLRKEPFPDAEFVSTSQYALIYGLSEYTVREYANKGYIKNAKKGDKNNWLFPRDEAPNPVNMLPGRKKKSKNTNTSRRRVSSGSAADVEEYILKHKLFTRAVAPFIHTFEELDYYDKKNYHEVCWDGRPALIIDVNPDYRDSVEQRTNRERMEAGEAPVVPSRNKEEYVFHVHHVGQNIKSPFAIIPAYDHNGTGLSAVFHQGTPNEDLHTTEYHAQKEQFWQNYIKAYDRAKGFIKIPYLNPRRKRK